MNEGGWKGVKRDEKGWKEIKKDVENDIVHVSNCPLVKRYDCACQKVKMSWFEIPECLVHFNFRVKLHSHAFSYPSPQRTDRQLLAILFSMYFLQ